MSRLPVAKTYKLYIDGAFPRSESGRTYEAEGANVTAILADLDTRYPGIRERICDESGQVRRFVNIFVNGEDIRFLKHLDTPLKAGDELSIVPAIAGGR